MSSNNKNFLKQTTKLPDESEDIYKLLVESVYDYAIFMLDAKGRVKTWNKGAERIKGYSAKEIIGKHFSTFYLKQAIDEDFPAYELKQAVKVGRFEDEGWRVKKDGSTFWANVIITPVYKDGKHIGFSKVTRDLTERLRNDELMRKNKELLRINTDLDNFIYTASHDLKSPITNLEGLLTLLNQKVEQKVTSDETKIIHLMNTSLLRLKKTIGDLTEVTKIQKGLEEIAEEISLHELVKEVKRDIEMQIAEADAEIEEHFGVATLTFSRIGLKSILYNLISNAIKYRSPDRPVKIKMNTYTTEGHVALSVKDNGLGLKKEQQEKLFTIFKRFHSHVEGTGIGLYMIKRIIENSGGWIDVKSQPDQGSEFIVHFSHP